MKLKLGQTLEQSHTITITPEISQRIATSLATVQWEICGEPTERIQQAYEHALNSLDPGTAHVIETCIDQTWIPHFQEFAYLLCGGREILLREFLVKQILKAHHNRFKFNVTDDTGKPFTEEVQVEFARLWDALIKPDAVRTEVKKVQDFLQSNPDNAGINASGYVHELLRSLRVAEALQEYLAGLQNGLQILLFSGKDADGLPPLLSALRELQILNVFRPIASARLLTRFLTRCRKIQKKDRAEQHHNAFLNTIGEYTLIAMGILDPDIFVHCKRTIPEEDTQYLEKEFSKNGMDLASILKHYQLQGGGTLHWNRWKHKRRAPCADMDEALRLFLVHTVRKDQAALLQELEFPARFQEWKDLVHNDADSDEEQDSALEMSLAEFFEENQETLLARLKGPWFRELAKLA